MHYKPFIRPFNTENSHFRITPLGEVCLYCAYCVIDGLIGLIKAFHSPTPLIGKATPYPIEDLLRYMCMAYSMSDHDYMSNYCGLELNHN